ncbi:MULTISPECIES: dihydroxyacetone kinase subunit DhaK [Paenarthrobacter]|jgi:dihydroxyacetone kinase-like protein|uniref:dihydroxyacetone kinase subunit DhaK n=1 Tax=Paenarthrobacter TaxID=1742992 RepID=UPI000367929D|nr:MULTISPECIES: dihydroxyacetone kinase subunit DhaK [Paenarthrobacter]KIA75126.1 dihydroxyacetone kinase subunit DhaK [Arthrobacter sp. MWB30]KQR03659.1 dihydroxyacetone kinase [Arthrobacter sp. Leaf145]SKB98048.1 dihydroxyacetone kinase DhaK subunit [Arthrobacter sp. 31Cvi3.1E]BCW08887.1 dihydroxyacetone kinase subunit DhaK [Arthrobacter sp. NtRootA2]BCW17078.1 dihydroxyacetone kinase subunit DhaK [Arthrobacter sp. NtRootA4]BCW21302.1 dihydroxyacetone kinase subunit DhaK [Arthrobacter sp. 
MKKLINDPRAVVDESVDGFGMAHADIVDVHPDPKFVVRKGAPVAGKVALVSGGGSGHEPLHAGFVGLGMLDAAVPGAVFTSPTPDQIIPATVAVDSGAGVVHIVKNYTGDVLNFETAAEMAQAEGVRVRSVLVNDDVAVEDSLYTAGRRGVGGTVLVEKIAGASAQRGDDLDAVTAIAERVVANVRTMGVALSGCTVPHAGTPSFELADDEIEIGIGIHGEPGRHRIAMESADAITDRLLEPVLEDLSLASGDKVLLFVNGMGGTPLSELYIVYRRAAHVLAERGATVERSLVGNYVTSLEMQGCSVSVLRLDDEMTRLWDAPVHTAALRWGA